MLICKIREKKNLRILLIAGNDLLQIMIIAERMLIFYSSYTNILPTLLLLIN